VGSAKCGAENEQTKAINNEDRQLLEVSSQGGKRGAGVRTETTERLSESFECLAP